MISDFSMIPIHWLLAADSEMLKNLKNKQINRGIQRLTIKESDVSAISWRHCQGNVPWIKHAITLIKYAITRVTKSPVSLICRS